MSPLSEPTMRASGHSDSSAILVRDHGSVRVISLNRPSRRNALDLAARLELLAALRSGAAQAPAIVLTGEGPIFSAGGDIRGMTDDPVEAGARLDALGALAHELVHCAVPIVAAVEGGAYGAGLSLVSATSYVVSGRSARFEASFGKIGLGPDTGLSWTLPRRVGLAHARRMMLMLLTLEGESALDAGLVDELVDDGDAVARAIEVASTLAELSAPMVAGLSELLAHSAATIAEATAAEARLQRVLLRSPESLALRARFLGGMDAKSSNGDSGS